MVAANYDHRMHLHASHEHMMSDEHFAREFKTLHFDIGRQVGKTSLILELARPSDMIVVHNRATQHRLLQIRGACRASIVTPTEVEPYRIYRNLGDSYVWIDEPSVIGNAVDMLYQRIRAGLFIKLGE